MKPLSWRWLSVAVVAAAGCTGLAWWLMIQSPVRFGAVAVTEDDGMGRLVYGYLVTLVGVVLGAAYRNLQIRREAGEHEVGGVGQFLRTVFLSLDFWMGVCGSPLVYALLMRATEGGSMAGLTAIAIENGFFCTIVIRGLAPKVGARRQP